MKRVLQLLALLAVLLVAMTAPTHTAAVQASARPTLVSAPARSLDAVNCAVSPAKTGLSADEQAFLTLLNNFRTQNGLSTVQLDNRLVQSSAWFSQDHAQNGYQTADPTGHNNPDHVDSLGRYIDKRLADCDFPTNIDYRENVWYAWPPDQQGATAQGAFDGWYNLCDADQTGTCTYGHRKTMLDANATVAGIARVVGPKGGQNGQLAAHWTLDIGNPGAGNVVSFPPQQAGPMANGFGGQWTMLDNNAATTAIVAEGTNLYQLHNDGSIWKYTGTPLVGWQLLDDNPATVQIVPGAGGNLYQLHSNREIWKYTGTPDNPKSWLQIDNNPATKAVVPSNSGPAVYQLHDNGKIWKYTGTPDRPNSWLQLDDNPATVLITPDGDNLYQLHNTGKIWKYTGTPDNPNSWQLIDDNPAAVSIKSDGGNLYQAHNDGSLWKYTGTPLVGWLQVDNNPATIGFAVAGPNLYQRHNDGSVWRYTGTPSNPNAWLQLDADPSITQTAAGGEDLYKLNNKGEIWRHNR